MKYNLLFAIALIFCLCPSMQAQKGNLIETNNSFTLGGKDWSKGVYEDDDGKPTAKVEADQTTGQDDNQCIKVSIRKSAKGNPNKVFIQRKDLKLRKNKKYRLTFWVKSRFADDQVRAVLYSGADTGSNKPWAAVLEKMFKFTGDGKWKKQSVEFTAKSFHGVSEPDYGKIYLIFGFNSRRGTFYFDNVTLERAD